MDELDPSVIDLQLRFMKLEREVAELSAVVAAQQRMIDTLNLEVRRQREQEPLGQPPIEDARPPHY